MILGTRPVLTLRLMVATLTPGHMGARKARVPGMLLVSELKKVPHNSNLSHTEASCTPARLSLHAYHIEGIVFTWGSQSNISFKSDFSKRWNK